MQAQGGDFFTGLSMGLDAMMRVINGEALPPPSGLDEMQLGKASLLPVIFVTALMIGGLMRRLMGRGKAAVITGALVGLAVWLWTGLLLFALLSVLIGIIVNLAGTHLGGGWGGGSGGSGGGGGLRDGGGGFGGGGASGRW
ncbi:MAG: hypothetical protein RL564_759 [Pseudomonadota bacterium]